MGDTENKIPLRSEVAVENTWALEDLYATDDDWKADMERLKSMMQQIAGYQGKLGESSASLLAYLKLQDDINIVMTDFANYAFRRADEDTRNTTYQGFKSQTNSLIVAITGACSFAEPEILSIPDEKLEQFYAEQPELSVYKRLSVIGDGALTGGMAYEALNNAAELKTNFIIVLNDNNMSISKNVGGMSSYLSALRTAEVYTGMKINVTKTLKKIPKVGTAVVDTMRRTKSSIKQLIIPGMLFENMGLTYLGPVDGHDMRQMMKLFNEAQLLKLPFHRLR